MNLIFGLFVLVFTVFTLGLVHDVLKSFYVYAMAIEPKKLTEMFFFYDEITHRVFDIQCNATDIVYDDSTGEWVVERKEVDDIRKLSSQLFVLCISYWCWVVLAGAVALVLEYTWPVTIPIISLYAAAYFIRQRRQKLSR